MELGFLLTMGCQKQGVLEELLCFYQLELQKLKSVNIYCGKIGHPHEKSGKCELK